MSRGTTYRALGFALVLITFHGSSSPGQYPLGGGLRGPVALPPASPQRAGGYGYGYGGGYAPYVGVFPPYQGGYGYGGYDPGIAAVPSAAYFTYGNTSYTTESPSPIPVYGGPRTPYAPLPPPTRLTALLKVQVPLDAEVWLEGHKMRSSGALRHYRSPPLDPTKGYIYEVRARWMFDGKPVEDVRHVDIRAGAIALVDFTHLDPLVPRPSLPAEKPSEPKKSSAPSVEKGQ